MGRPAKDEADRKTNVFRIRMTDSERLLIDAASNAEGQDTSSWARAVLIRAAKRRMGVLTTNWKEYSKQKK